MILPGVTIGDSCIVGAGSVPPNCIVAGNPAQILYTDVHLLSYGRVDPAWPSKRVSDPTAVKQLWERPVTERRGL